MKNNNWKFILGYLLFIFIAIAISQSSINNAQPKQVGYSDFIGEVRAGHVNEVTIAKQELIGKLNNVADKKLPQMIIASRLPGIDDANLLKEMEAHQVKIYGRAESSSWMSDLFWGWVVPFIIILIIFNLFFSSGKGLSGLSFGKTKAKLYDQTSHINVTFNDVAGVNEAKAELVEVVDFLKNPQKYQRLGGHIPKGVLLVGAPGTGKTLLAKAVSGEANVPFFSISGSEFVEMFVGVGAARVRDLFAQAKLRAPCIIFIDELDAIGKSRNAGHGMIMGHDEREQTLNQLLAEMDGFDTSKGVIIMAATNTPEVLDAALLRAGRFDRQVIVDRPDLQGREEILRVHARNIKLDEQADLKMIAARTPGMVGADLANIINEAALLAARHNADSVKLADIEEAINRVMLGLEKKGRVMDTKEKERVAYHETGHAIVALSIKNADPVHRISIIPRSIGALGYTLQLPTREKYLMTKPELEDRIAILMGGSAAEEVIYNGIISTGAADDLEKASELARQMVTRFGMSKRLGHMSYGKPLTGRFLPSIVNYQERTYSEYIAEQIDEETRNIIDEIYARVCSILTERRRDLEVVAKELIKSESLDRSEIEKLLKQKEVSAA